MCPRKTQGSRVQAVLMKLLVAAEWSVIAGGRG